MRISKTTLTRNWLVTTLAASVVFAVLLALDLRLKLLSGVGTADLQGFGSALQFDAAFHYWGTKAYLSRAGFNLGFDYLLMPLYAAAFFYSGIIVRETFAPRPGLARRLIGLAAMAPIAGAVLDAGENAITVWMLWEGPADNLARIAFTVSSTKMTALYIGILLLAGAVFAQIQARRMRTLKT